MKFVVDKVALLQVFLRVLLLFPPSTIPSIFRTHLHLHVALRILQKKSSISEMSDHWMGTYLRFYGAYLRENLVSSFILTMPTRSDVTGNYGNQVVTRHSDKAVTSL